MSNSHRPCPVCSSDKSSPFLDGSLDRAHLTKFSYASRKEPEFMNFPYVTCESCDLVYTPTPPKDEDLSHAYIEADFDSSDEAFFAAETYQKILKPWIKKLANKICAVDIGSGNGALLPLLIDEGFKNVAGIEPSAAAISSAPQEIKALLREGVFSEDIIKDLSPDFVCAAMTMEHVPHPMELMQVIRNRLSEDGMVAIIVHNRRAFINRLLGKRSPIIDIEHLQLFSPKSLETLFVKSGLKPLFIGSFCNSYPLRYWVRLLPLPITAKRAIIGLLDKLKLSRIKITLPVGNLLGIAQKS